MQKWVSVAEATQILNISERSLRYRISKGSIESKLSDSRRLVCVEIDDTLHETPHATSYDTPHEMLHEKDQRIADLQKQVDSLQEQLSEKDKQIDHLTQIVAMSQKNIATLTDQLDTERRMLEDIRQRRTVWQRLKAAFVAAPG